MRHRRRALRRRYGRAHAGVWSFDTLKEAVKNARALGATHQSRHLSGRGWTFAKPITSGKYAGEFEQWEVTRNEGAGYIQHGLAVVKSLGSRATPIRGAR